MFYNKLATVMTTTKTSNGMGGWETSEPHELAFIRVAASPITSEAILKQYGIITTSGLKLFTEDVIPSGDNFIKFNQNNYRILQLADYGVEKVLLLELMS